MKFQAAFLPDVSFHEFEFIFGPIEVFSEDGQEIYITRPFDSAEHLRTLCGTFQGRLERAGLNFTGAIIQPYGVKPPKDKRKYRVSSPLKTRMDYDRGTSMDPVMYELRPHFQKHYGAEELKHPETVIFPPNEFYKDGLTEQQVVNYYGSVQNKIIEQYTKYNLDGLIKMKVNNKVIIKRHASLGIQSMDIHDQNDFDSLNKGRTVEFHFAIGKETPMVWVDLDPKEGFPFEDVGPIAVELAKKLGSMPESDHVEVRFSGGDGMHVICFMKGVMPTDPSKKELDKFVDEYLEEKKDERLTKGATKDKESMRLDISTFHSAGGLRAAYSLSYPTGLVCLPIPLNKVTSFKKGDATMENVSGTSLVTASLDILAKMETAADLQKAIEDWRNFGKIPEDLSDIEKLSDLLTNPRTEAGALEWIWKNIDPELQYEELIKMIIDMRSEAGQKASESLPEEIKKAGAEKFDQTLKEYREKRTFDKTSEPTGEAAPETKNVFVVQQHAAHHAGLHFDFRLAHEGVLKSWAIPKLMSLVSGKQDRVLAIETEDHPTEYRTFEGSLLSICERKLIALHGSIPAGEYGGGKIDIWDEGTFKTVSKDDDHWKFDLQGSRLKGTYVLFRTGGDKWNLRKGKEVV